MEIDDNNEENKYDKCCDICEKQKLFILTFVCIFLIVLYVFLLI